jgi:hypothetical protein
MLCALAFSAIAAQGANAEVKGVTVFTCKVPSGSDVAVGEAFTDEHCKEKSGAGTFRHVVVAEGTTTEITGTSTNTQKLKSTQSGVNEELQSPLAHILVEHNGEKSWLTNAVDPVTKEHYVHGEAWVEYTGVEVTAPAGKGCEVVGGTVTTNKLKFTTKGQGMEVLFEPASGTVFAEFTIAHCESKLNSLNHLYKVEGSLKATVNGATLETTHTAVTGQNTLKSFGQKAGLEGAVTIKGTEIAVDGLNNDKPLSLTTVETP